MVYFGEIPIMCSITTKWRAHIWHQIHLWDDPNKFHNEYQGLICSHLMKTLGVCIDQLCTPIQQEDRISLSKAKRNSFFLVERRRRRSMRAPTIPPTNSELITQSSPTIRRGQIHWFGAGFPSYQGLLQLSLQPGCQGYPHLMVPSQGSPHLVTLQRLDRVTIWVCCKQHHWGLQWRGPFHSMFSQKETSFLSGAWGIQVPGIAPVDYKAFIKSLLEHFCLGDWSIPALQHSYCAGLPPLNSVHQTRQ